MDIVKRLQKSIYHDNYGSLPADAAAEIERLRALLEEAEDHMPWWDHWRERVQAALRGEGVK